MSTTALRRVISHADAAIAADVEAKDIDGKTYVFISEQQSLQLEVLLFVHRP